MGSPGGPLRHPAPWLLAGSLLLLFGCYALGSGITSTNDGSHYALLRALHDEGRTALGPEVVFARHDTARFEGRAYADRAPGTSLLALAFVRALQPALAWMQPLRMDPWSRRLLVGSESFVALVMLLPALAAALLFPALYGLLRELGEGTATALVLAFAAVPSTLLLRYGTVLYSHELTTLLVVGAVLAWLRWGRAGGLGWLALGSALLSWAVVVEYTPVLLFAPAIAWGLTHPSGRGRRPLSLAVFVAAGLPALFALGAYNQASFGSPFSIAHFHHSSVPEHHAVGSTFDLGNVPRHAWRLLFEPRDFRSVFAASPQLLLALPGLALAFARERERWREHAWMAASALLALLPVAAYAVEVGGYDRDHRQMLFGLPFLWVFVAVALRQLPGRAALAGWAFWALASLWAVGVQLDHVRHAGQLEFADPFVNAGPAAWNVLPLALPAVALAGAGWAWRWACGRGRQPAAPGGAQPSAESSAGASGKASGEACGDEGDVA